ncbi:hypothetical protein FJZ31_30055 [Candidatus Poribacteria bacterium]|nr:hypothetical protein [Candidatus Poribacteria bacterium]
MNKKPTKCPKPISTSILMLVIFGLACSSCVTASKSTFISRTATQQSQTGAYTFTLRVDDLDNQSQAKIQAEMQKIGNVEGVQVNQKSGLVYITFKTNSKISNNQVMQAVKQAGYKPKEVVKGPLDLGQLEQNMPKKK